MSKSISTLRASIFATLTAATLFAGCGGIIETDTGTSYSAPQAPTFSNLDPATVAFTMSNDASSNELYAFSVHPDTHLTKPLIKVSTGGKGGAGGNGDGVAASPLNDRVAAVNFGSGTVTVFKVSLTNKKLNLAPTLVTLGTGQSPLSVVFSKDGAHLYVLSGKKNGNDTAPIIDSYRLLGDGSSTLDGTVSIFTADSNDKINGPAEIIVTDNGKVAISVKGTDHEDGWVFLVNTELSGAVNSAMMPKSLSLPSRQTPFGMAPAKEGGFIVTIAHTAPNNLVLMYDANGELLNSYPSSEGGTCWATSTHNGTVIATGNTGAHSVTLANLNSAFYSTDLAKSSTGYNVGNIAYTGTFGGASDITALGDLVGTLVRPGNKTAGHGNLMFYSLSSRTQYVGASAQSQWTMSNSTVATAEVPPTANGVALLDLTHLLSQ